MGWGPWGIFGNWANGDLFDDKGPLGKVHDGIRFDAQPKGGASGAQAAWIQSPQSAPASNSVNTGYYNAYSGGGGGGGQGGYSRPYSVGGGGGGGRSNAASAAAAAAAAREARDKANAIAQYDETIRRAESKLGGLHDKLATGIDNINADIGRQKQKQQNALNEAEGLYNLNVQDTVANNRNARDQIAEGARDQTRALQNIFASGQAGDSSFAKIQAPFLIGKAATKNQSAVQDQFARNRRDQDMGIKKTRDEFWENDNALNDARENRANALRAQINEFQGNLYDQIAEATRKKAIANGSSGADANNLARSFADKADFADKRVTELSRDQVTPVKELKFDAPALANYSENTGNVAVNSGNKDQAGLQDQLDPAVQNLLDPNKKKKETGVA